MIYQVTIHLPEGQARAYASHMITPLFDQLGNLKHLEELSDDVKNILIQNSLNLRPQIVNGERRMSSFTGKDYTYTAAPRNIDTSTAEGCLEYAVLHSHKAMWADSPTEVSQSNLLYVGTVTSVHERAVKLRERKNNAFNLVQSLSSEMAKDYCTIYGEDWRSIDETTAKSILYTQADVNTDVVVADLAPSNRETLGRRVLLQKAQLLSLVTYTMENGYRYMDNPLGMTEPECLAYLANPSHSAILSSLLGALRERTGREPLAKEQDAKASKKKETADQLEPA